MTTPVERAREMKDVKFLHLGRDHNGIDCIGLVAYAEQYPIEKIPPYGRDPVDGQLERQLDSVLGAPLCTCGPQGVQANTLVAGDVVVLAYGRRCRHVGLVAQHPTIEGVLSIIHSDSTLGRVTEHSLDEKWLRRIRRVYRP